MFQYSRNSLCTESHQNNESLLTQDLCSFFLSNYCRKSWVDGIEAVKRKSNKTFVLFQIFIFSMLSFFKGFLVFGIRKNLDLRKISVTLKIFFKSREHCTTEHIPVQNIPYRLLKAHVNFTGDFFRARQTHTKIMSHY